MLTLCVGAYLGKERANDFGESVEMARNLLAGRGLRLDTWFGPSYSYMPVGLALVKALFMFLFTDPALPLSILFIVTTALTKVAFFSLARRFFSWRGAFLATALWILYPPGWFWGTRVHPHTYVMDASVVALWATFVAWETRGWRPAAASGVLLGTMALTRGEWVPGLLIFLGFTLWAVKERSQALKICGIMFLGWALVMSPWVIRNWRIHHRFLLGTTYTPLVMWMAFNPNYHFTGDAIDLTPELMEKLSKEPNEVDKGKIVMRDMIARVRAHPSLLWRTMSGNAIRFWRLWPSADVASHLEIAVYVLSWTPLFILFVVGLFQIPYRDPHWQAIAVLLAFRYAVQIPTYVIVRFREMAIPFIILVACLPLVRRLALFRDHESPKPLA